MADPTTVPDGHELALIRASVVPGVTRMPGDAIVASLGIASDDVDHELDEIAKAVEVCVREARRTVLVRGPAVPMHELFAPAAPAADDVPAPVLWVLHRGALATLELAPARLARFVAMLRAVRANGLAQAVYIVEESTARHARLATALAELEVPLRAPALAAPDEPPIIAAAVRRPDGMLTALAGGPLALAPDAQDEPAFALRGPRLRELVLAMRAGGSAAMSALVQELLARELPMLVIRDDAKRAALRTFGDVVALPAYGDLTTFNWAVHDLERPRSEHTLGALEPAQLIATAAAGKLAIVIGAYLDRDQPLYALVPADMVRELADLAGN